MTNVAQLPVVTCMFLHRMASLYHGGLNSLRKMQVANAQLATVFRWNALIGAPSRTLYSAYTALTNYVRS